MKVLSIGNSFTASVCRQLPPMAEHEGLPLAYANLFIGGCPLRRHAENLAASAADPSFRPYRLRPPASRRAPAFATGPTPARTSCSRAATGTS